MCTVTYIPTKYGFYLTTNRDEHLQRGAALPPAVFNNRKYKLLYPTDPDKRGSWIAARDNGDAIVLLNGAFVRHGTSLKYTTSRGLILLQAIAASEPELFFDNADLTTVEPFTLVICTGQRLFECRWDGVNKHNIAMDRDSPQIWCSATLYDETAHVTKADRFRSFCNAAAKLTGSAIANFHRKEQLKGNISTVSITQVAVMKDRILMSYNDLKTDKRHFVGMGLDKPTVPWLGFRILVIKLFNWEYWPYYLVYGPVMLHWFWLSIRSRTLFFFNTANPGMKNGGFAMDRKSQTYLHLPQGNCPRTILVKAGSALNVDELPLPLIAKPDIGQRGLQVKLLWSKNDLADYFEKSKVDFLLQEYIDLPQEIGIFYYRSPGSGSPVITGIVGKELMRITGDGYSTMLELLVKEQRYLLQLPTLLKNNDRVLQRVLAEGQHYHPAPYGNHCRGARFVDLSARVTEQLTERIHSVCRQLPGFHYGRLDIKFNTWAELCEGEFKVIEVNGAASEPAHMYDPKHSIFFAWKEIIRHWSILHKISMWNRHHQGLPYMTYREGMTMIRNNAHYVNSTI